ncbi:hypothetical protein Ahy_Scaffold1g107246 [Arachis hypogaea]|uniref:Uncharacterized protein n=1 Tax=Arachis hypogaea TaxID=3818 RepID=A0A444WV12_ARAHY|nr:hypothetical protein Ahy_Scaffold1g107246 [Arachis hypogaea]
MEFESLSLANEVIEFDMIGLGDDGAIDIEHHVEDDDDYISVDNEAANKVARATKNDGRLVISNGTYKEDLRWNNEATTSYRDPQTSLQQSSSKDDHDRTIEKLTRQLDRAQRKCEVYRSNLLSILKDMEEQKLELSVKVQNIKLGMKD